MQHMRSGREIEYLLRAELEKASSLHEQAKREFWRVSADIPSDLPHPDGTQRIQNAARAQTAAMEALYQALRRFNAFLVDGSVPEDLKESLTERHS
jgi:hypothetical protein